MGPPSAPSDRRDAVALHPVDLQPATPAGKERRPELPLEVGLHLKELLARIIFACTVSGWEVTRAD
jgi:hypothetical protein